jgi:hypothetical protein
MKRILIATAALLLLGMPSIEARDVTTSKPAQACEGDVPENIRGVCASQEFKAYCLHREDDPQVGSKGINPQQGKRISGELGAGGAHGVRARRQAVRQEIRLRPRQHAAVGREPEGEQAIWDATAQGAHG